LAQRAWIILLCASAQTNSAVAVLARRAHCSNVPRSSALKINAGIERPVRM
jgi:hypothetical protein